jgi:hypothetical protein
MAVYVSESAMHGEWSAKPAQLSNPQRSPPLPCWAMRRSLGGHFICGAIHRHCSQRVCPRPLLPAPIQVRRKASNCFRRAHDVLLALRRLCIPFGDTYIETPPCPPSALYVRFVISPSHDFSLGACIQGCPVSAAPCLYYERHVIACLKG